MSREAFEGNWDLAFGRAMPGQSDLAARRFDAWWEKIENRPDVGSVFTPSAEDRDLLATFRGWMRKAFLAGARHR